MRRMILPLRDVSNLAAPSALTRRQIHAPLYAWLVLRAQVGRAQISQFWLSETSSLTPRFPVDPGLVGAVVAWMEEPALSSAHRRLPETFRPHCATRHTAHSVRIG